MDISKLNLDYQVKKEELFKEQCFFDKYSDRQTNMSEYTFNTGVKKNEEEKSRD